MTINDIMLRDMADAEREEREAERTGARRSAFAVRLCCMAAVALAAAVLALLAWCCVSDAAHVFNISC
ncbi:MAG: hypothetical protein II823_07275 [Kiritimatiellae bacterium]|nr:hypothetical protein [Kiritimatiellia bacterium]